MEDTQANSCKSDAVFAKRRPPGNSIELYEVCVFGGGPAGLAVASRLADLGVATIVLNRARARKAWPGESLTGAIRQPLSDLGLWEVFRDAGHVAGFAQRTAWGGEPWVQESIFGVQGNRWHVDRRRFDSDLRDGALRRGVAIREYRDLAELMRDGNHWRIGADNGNGILARYIVDATGRAHAIAGRLGVKPRVYDRLIGFTALMPRNRNPEFDHTMVIEATAQGWWYAAPVPDGHVLCFFTDADLAPEGMGRSMRKVAANSTYAQAAAGEAWLTVGDACAAHDPLCGWGVHRGMTNGIAAANAICAYLRTGDESPLGEYRLHCEAQFERYLAGLHRHYCAEKRWASEPFWDRRSHAITFHPAHHV